MSTYDTRPFYYSQVRVDPKNSDRVYWSSTQMLISNDGGKTTAETGVANELHTDDHGMWIDPNDPERFAIADDGGIAITFDKGANFFYPANVPISQFYEVSFDYAVPYNICGGAQDNGVWCGPSRRRTSINNSYWFTIVGGDGFYTALDPQDPNWVWGESQGGAVSGRNLKTGQGIPITKPTWQTIYRQDADSIAIARGDPLRQMSPSVKARVDSLRAKQRRDSASFTMRYNWDTPFLLSTHDNNVFYFGGNRLLKSTARGANLMPISPDLSKQNPARLDTALRLTGGITNDATGAETYGTIVSLGESPMKAGWLIAGTDDGNVWMTHNDGVNWENVSDRFPGLPGNDLYVTGVEPSWADTNTFYVALENHRWNDFTPYLYATNDGGRTFHSIVSNLPKDSPADYLHVVREDPHNRNLLYVGSSRSVYVSIDRGQSWTKFANGLPTVPVFDLKIHPRDREMMIATHGRGFWFVDVAPLEQVTDKVVAANTYLFQPKTSYQWAEAPRLNVPDNGPGQQLLQINGPPYGAEIYYRMGTGVTGPVSFTVSDAAGHSLFQTTGVTTPGLHSVLWGYTGAVGAAAPRAQSPSERMDSLLLHVRAPKVLDSLRAAHYDSVARLRGCRPPSARRCIPAVVRRRGVDARAVAVRLEAVVRSAHRADAFRLTLRRWLRLLPVVAQVVGAGVEDAAPAVVALEMVHSAITRSSRGISSARARRSQLGAVAVVGVAAVVVVADAERAVRRQIARLQLRRRSPAVRAALAAAVAAVEVAAGDVVAPVLERADEQRR